MRLAPGLRPDLLGELTALPQTPSWIWGNGRRWGGRGKGMGERKRAGVEAWRGDREKEGWMGQEGRRAWKEKRAGRGGVFSPQYVNRSDTTALARAAPRF